MRDVCTGRGLRVAGAALLGAALAGCSSSTFTTPAPTLTSFFSNASAAATTGTGQPADPGFECPSVSVRAGASTLSYSANPSEESAMNLRYQIGIGQTARECKLNGQTVTMRVGMQGRVVLGPQGQPGTIEVPVRLAVVHEGPSPKTITTKLNRVPVNVTLGDSNVVFTMIEEDLSFPMPRGGVIDEYIVYVGFDPHGAREPARRPERRAPAKPAR